jgi:hypothetical protein
MLQSHILLDMIWFTIATVGTLSHHSGYKRFWQIGSLDPTFHGNSLCLNALSDFSADYHHYAFNYHFGTL